MRLRFFDGEDSLNSRSFGFRKLLENGGRKRKITARL